MLVPSGNAGRCGEGGSDSASVAETLRRALTRNGGARHCGRSLGNSAPALDRSLSPYPKQMCIGTHSGDVKMERVNETAIEVLMDEYLDGVTGGLRLGSNDALTALKVDAHRPLLETMADDETNI